MIGSIEEEDAREERRRRREEARATRDTQPPAMLTQFDEPTGDHHHEIPTPAAMPAKAEPPTARPAAFELVGELPANGRPTGRKTPAVRDQLIEFAKAHTGQWIRYNPTPEDPFKSASSVATQIRKGHAGFSPGFEANVRNKVLFIRYVGEK